MFDFCFYTNIRPKKAGLNGDLLKKNSAVNADANRGAAPICLSNFVVADLKKII